MVKNIKKIWWKRDEKNSTKKSQEKSCKICPKKRSQHWTQGCNKWSCVRPKMEAHSEITIIPRGCAGKQGNISRIGIRPNTYKAHTETQKVIGMVIWIRHKLSGSDSAWLGHELDWIKKSTHVKNMLNETQRK